MAYTDTRGLEVSTTSPEALDAYERGVDLFLRWRSGALEALNLATHADPHFAMAHCTKAFMAWRMGNVNVAVRRPSAGDGGGATDMRTEREQLHLQAVDAMHRGEPLVADELLDQIGPQYPTDRLAAGSSALSALPAGIISAGSRSPIAAWRLARTTSSSRP